MMKLPTFFLAEKNLDDPFIQEKIYDLPRCLPTNAEKRAAEFRLTKVKLDVQAKKQSTFPKIGDVGEGGSFVGSFKGSLKKGKGSEDGK